MKIVVTTGGRFTDIDGLACCVAYNELLEKEGKKSEVVLPGPFNKSVTEKIRNWNIKFKTEPTDKKSQYILMDISEEEYFPDFTKCGQVVEVYDHRSGFEKYWEDRLVKNAKIELVGACATLIWEEFVKRIKSPEISSTSANLLYTAIASNTLNFNASVTTERDKEAFSQLKGFTSLPKDWIDVYFRDQQKEILKDPYEAVVNDTKVREITIGQLELWESKPVLDKCLPEIEKALTSFGNPKWFLTSPSISEGKNYLYTKDAEIKKLLSQIIGAKFKGDLGTTKKLWLRKEIVQKLQEKICRGAEN